MTTTTEIDRVADDSGTLEVFPPRQTPSLPAQQMLHAHAGMMQDAWQLADKMCATTMVPSRFYRKPEDGTAAILYGAELGMNPIQSLQRVIPIHGMPSIEGRTMEALLKARGFKFRWVEKSDERCELIGWDPRDQDSVEHPERSVWTIERATRAEYVPTKDGQDKWKTNSNGKLLGNMKYITDPQAMLKAKCQSEVCRDLAPEILMGIAYTTEDLESESWDDDRAVAERVSPSPSTGITVDDIIGGSEPAPAAKAKRERPSGTRTRKPEPVAEPVDAEVVADPDPDPAPEPEPEPASDDADPAPSEEEAKPEPSQVVEPTAGADAVRNQKIRKLFALLAKAEITERDDRLVIYRTVLKRPEVSSTNDLAINDLEYIAQGLEVLDGRGDLAQWCDAAISDAAEQAEQQAQSEPTTTTEGK